MAGRVESRAEEFVCTRESVFTAVIFAATVIGWAGGARFGRLLGIEADMHAVVALAVIGALVVTGVIGWTELEKDLQWILLLALISRREGWLAEAG